MLLRAFHSVSLIFTCAVLLTTTGLSQEVSIRKSAVPKEVLTSFEKAYPKATVKGYSKEKDQGNVVYEIESVEAKTHRDVSYATDGSVISVEESLEYADLPEPVRTAIAKDYSKAKVSTCEKVTKGPTTQFELVVHSGKQKHELVFKPDGSLVKKEKK